MPKKRESEKRAHSRVIASYTTLMDASAQVQEIVTRIEDRIGSLEDPMADLDLEDQSDED